MNRRIVVVLSVGIISISLVGCAGPMGKQGATTGAVSGALLGYGFGHSGVAAAAGAGLGLLVGGAIGGVADMFGAQSAAEARARGFTDCSMDERWNNGVYSQDKRCHSEMTRGGFRGDPLTPAPTPPTVRYETAEVVIQAYPSGVVTPVPPPPPPAPGPPWNRARPRSTYP